jgi:transcriptional regulator with XRE-family HTH domain
MTERDLRAILSQNIKNFRHHRKLSQADFAEKIDISIPFLSDIENGKKWISPVTLAKMADALNIDAYELLKPDKIIPDNTDILLEKYTAEIYKAFGDTLGDIREKYIHQIKNKNTDF